MSRMGGAGCLHCTLKCKKPHFQDELYQNCSFLCLSLGCMWVKVTQMEVTVREACTSLSQPYGSGYPSTESEDDARALSGVVLGGQPESPCLDLHADLKVLHRGEGERA
eukprot:3385892-Rhodomonas_salina.3